MASIELSLVTGGGLSARAFSDLYRALNEACLHRETKPPASNFPPVAIVVHVSGPVTDWGPPPVGRVVRRRKPRSLEVPVVISRLEWEELPRESHREVLIRRVGEAVHDAAATLESAHGEEAISLLEFWRLASDDFRAWEIPPDGLLGPPAVCPKCGATLRTPLARQCRICGADWH
jgi:hypothetical protein